MEFFDVAERLRAERSYASELELDRVRVRASRALKRRAPTPRGSQFIRSRRLVATLLALGVMAGGTGVFAAAKSSPPSSGASSSSSANSQYCPPSSQQPGKEKPDPGPSKCGKTKKK